MKEIKLTKKEIKLLLELLSIDLESIGFDADGDIDTFDSICKKLEN